LPLNSGMQTVGQKMKLIDLHRFLRKHQLTCTIKMKPAKDFRSGLFFEFHCEFIGKAGSYKDKPVKFGTAHHSMNSVFYRMVIEGMQICLEQRAYDQHTEFNRESKPY